MLVQQRKASEISLAERHQIIQEYLSTGKKKREIWYNYTGQKEEHGQILKWMRMYGYTETKENGIFVSVMAKKDQNIASNGENAHLKRKIKELEKSLEEANLKAFAYSTMIDVAEKEFNIAIRKK